MQFYPHQIEAASKLRNGCILCADVGIGKSRTALLYFWETVCQGKIEGSWEKPRTPVNLLIITTAKKRDDKEWEKEAEPFHLEKAGIELVVDSWNSIKKHKDLKNWFIIFDEQRVTGRGVWVTCFLKLTRCNKWILLTATPGDCWTDYIPVFLANGFYRNKTDFANKHIIYSPYTTYPKIDRFVNETELLVHRDQILVKMDFKKPAESTHYYICCKYDKVKYRTVMKDRWNPFDNEPIEEAGKLFYLLRKVTNSDESRIEEVKRILERHKKVIIFYNFDYELEQLKQSLSFFTAEWNGHLHQPVPECDEWAYLVQYTSGCEGWNCVTCDTIVFYSQNYSYKTTVQAAGRIDRLNTPFSKLYFYHLRSLAPIDNAILSALKQKKNFNEKSFFK